MINEKKDHKNKYIDKCTQRDDSPNQKETIYKDISSSEIEKYLDQ